MVKLKKPLFYRGFLYRTRGGTTNIGTKMVVLYQFS